MSLREFVHELRVALRRSPILWVLVIAYVVVAFYISAVVLLVIVVVFPIVPLVAIGAIGAIVSGLIFPLIRGTH